MRKTEREKALEYLAKQARFHKPGKGAPDHAYETFNEFINELTDCLAFFGIIDNMIDMEEFEKKCGN